MEKFELYTKLEKEISRFFNYLKCYEKHANEFRPWKRSPKLSL